jgi:hypothetical protein
LRSWGREVSQAGDGLGGGWFSYLTRSGLLFTKKYPVFPDRVYSEMAGLTISIWYFKNEMCELEPIGPREILATGASASFTESGRWRRCGIRQRERPSIWLRSPGLPVG